MPDTKTSDLAALTAADVAAADGFPILDATGPELKRVGADEIIDGCLRVGSGIVNRTSDTFRVVDPAAAANYLQVGFPAVNQCTLFGSEAALNIACAAFRYKASAGGTEYTTITAAVYTMSSAVHVGWSSNTDAGNPADTGLQRSAAAVVRVTNGTTGGGSLEFKEVTAPGTPSATYARLYVEDDGGGKQRLVIKWDDGATSVIETQP